MIDSRLGRCIDTAKVKEINEKANDWSAICPICGERLTGTIDELRAHKHGK